MPKLRRFPLVLVALLAAACGTANGDAAGGGPHDGAVGPGVDGGGGPTDGSAGGPDAAAPPPVCDPVSFGAKHDGKTKDTAALQAAIDACAGKGGTVHLHDGT